MVEEVRWIDKGTAFLWISERDGWQHVYRVPRLGGEGTLITRFDADVTDVVGTRRVAGLAVLSRVAGERHRAIPLSIEARWIRRARARDARRTSPARTATTLAPRGGLAFHSWSQFDRPPVTDVVELPGHRSLRALTDPSALGKKLTDVLKPPVEFLTVDIGGGVVLDGWMLKPASFNPSRKYPVIVYVYGEPAGQTVTESLGRHAHALPSRPRRRRLHHRLVRQPRDAGAERARRGGKSSTDRSAICH